MKQSKTGTILFVIVNIIFFAFNFVVIPILPNPILFGWLSLHYLLFFGTAPIGSIIWGIYFIRFFARQKDL
ncbi:hypothetical protein [Lawsonibacter celer]|jgi:hypothetical protein|uniref:hypothetical protein n=1 Tax=Lawsonibacter celer TaxID=2986526 RepID=UPI001648BAAD|nr:hypothetical protein [Lawsonibacter celer]